MKPLSALFVLMAQGYGARLTLREAGEALGMSRSTAEKRVAAGEFPVPIAKDGGQWFVDIRHLAEYLDAQAEAAKKAHESA